MLNLTKKSAFVALALTLLAAGAANAQPVTHQSAPVTAGTPSPCGDAMPDGEHPHGDHGPHGGPMGGKMFEKADTNHDGFLTLDEMLAAQRERTERMFKEADTNHDGKLSHEEIHAWREAMRARMMQRWAAHKAAWQEQHGASPVEANQPVTPQNR